MERYSAMSILAAIGAALAGESTMSSYDDDSTIYAKKTKRLKCNNETDSCIGWCSIADISGTETTFCFTAKECHKFQREHDGTKCKKTSILD